MILRSAADGRRHERPLLRVRSPRLSRLPPPAGSLEVSSPVGPTEPRTPLRTARSERPGSYLGQASSRDRTAPARPSTALSSESGTEPRRSPLRNRMAFARGVRPAPPSCPPTLRRHGAGRAGRSDPPRVAPSEDGRPPPPFWLLVLGQDRARPIAAGSVSLQPRVRPVGTELTDTMVKPSPARARRAASSRPHRLPLLRGR